MTDQLLIVARLQPGAEPEVARLFGASDATELPGALGVLRRSLFAYQGLYFHHVEFTGPAGDAMRAARDRPDFKQLSDELSPHVLPYDPQTWRSPADAAATRFYSWQRGR
jgi:hypothetical protein